MTEEIKTVRHLKVVGGQETNATGPVNDECVALLEQVLELAKKGEIHTAFVVGQKVDRSILSGWSYSPPQYQSNFEMLGGIENAKLDFMLSSIERRD
jgi:hypothetical protein